MISMQKSTQGCLKVTEMSIPFTEASANATFIFLKESLRDL